MIQDTIAAIATPPGNGGVGIIRISGQHAADVLRAVFSHAGEYEHAKLHYGTVRHAGDVLDQALAVLFYAPHSYTGEDVAELHCHGSGIGIGRVLRAVYENGARPAQPGEFSKRAFLNGKMDLTQAEAVCDYIGAISTAGAKAGARQMRGELKRTLLQYQSRLTDVIAKVEAAVEYPEEDLEEVIAREELPVLMDLKNSIAQLEQSYREGRVVRDGLQVAIIGKPNVGKSSLMNALTQNDRAIVSDIPGTTRDTIEHTFEVNGIAIRLIDTAGIRTTSDKIEEMGTNRSINALKTANLVLFTLDCTNIWDGQDSFVCNQLKQSEADYWVVFNKLDACESRTDLPNIEQIDMQNVLFVSAKTGEGLDKLKDALYHFAVKDAHTESVLITSERHRALLQKTVEHLNDAIGAIEMGIDMDCVTIDLNLAWSSLGELTGNTVSEQIIDRIFEKFCLGK